jgi:hypothetical protein
MNPITGIARLLSAPLTSIYRSAASAKSARARLL